MARKKSQVRQVDGKGRVTLPAGFADCVVLVETPDADTVVLRRAVVTPASSEPRAGEAAGGEAAGGEAAAYSPDLPAEPTCQSRKLCAALDALDRPKPRRRKRSP